MYSAQSLLVDHSLTASPSTINTGLTGTFPSQWQDGETDEGGGIPISAIPWQTGSSEGKLSALFSGKSQADHSLIVHSPNDPLKRGVDFDEERVLYFMDWV